MKKCVALFGLFLGLLLGSVSLSHAGVAIDSFYPSQFPYYSSAIIASSSTQVGGPQSTLQLIIAAPAAGGSGASCRNCFTKEFVQLSTNVAVSVTDGLAAATTVQTILGVGLAASGVNTLSLPEDHLGPLCFTAGNSTVINAVVTAPFSGSSNPIVLNIEGYVQCKGSDNKGY